MTLEKQNPLISIIIVNYNAGELLLNCVESVFKTKYTNFEVILVDNVSYDKSHLKCKERFSKIRLIENEQNFGFCEGNNIGIRQARGEFAAILNPDTIVSENWLTELLAAYQTIGDGLYQPKILSLYEDNVIQSTGNMLHLFGFGFSRDKGVKDSNQYSKIERVPYASGTCLFTSVSALKKIKLFDPFVFIYHDDLHLGWRAAHIGIRSYFVPTTAIYHAESYTLKWSARKFFWLERNRRYCLLTHYSKSTYKKLLPYLIIVELMVWIFYLSKGFLIEKIKAEIIILRNRKNIHKKYEELEARKTVPDIELIKLMPDDIFVPENVSVGIGNRIFNSMLSFMSKRAKKSLLKID